MTNNSKGASAAPFCMMANPSHSFVRWGLVTYLLALGSLLTALSGCGGGIAGTLPPTPKPTVGLDVNPKAIAAGQSAALTLTASNATRVVIANNVDSTTFPFNGSGAQTVTVTPVTTTTYTATATGSDGQTASSSVTLTVTASAPAPTVALTASATTLTTGQSAVLTLTAANAVQVVIANNVDSTTFPFNGSGTQTVTVTPATTTTYTATATGSDGQTASSSVTLTVNGTGPVVALTASVATIMPGKSDTLNVVAANAIRIVISNNVDSTEFTLSQSGTQTVTPSTTTTYTATATGVDGHTASATAKITVVPINHVIFMLQENRSFDSYFGMLNPYRHSLGWNLGDDGTDYEVDGIDDKLTDPRFVNNDDEGNAVGLFKTTSSCMDDMSSAWLESYGDVNRFDFRPTRDILMDGFVHTAEAFAKSGGLADLQGRRVMGHYDQDFLNYYYFMASQFALSDRWFSPVSSKSISNRIATFSGGTTQGLVRDPGSNDHVGQVNIETVFHRLTNAGVSWKIYYTVSNDICFAGDTTCNPPNPDKRPATSYSIFLESLQYLFTPQQGAACTGNTQGSAVVGDPTNSFCIDTDHIAPLSQFLEDMNNGTLPSFAFVEAGFGHNDEHPGSGQSILSGQKQVASLLNSFMSGPSWKDSVFVLSYDEGGGPFDHVPPVPGSTNKFTAPALGITTDISSIAVNPDAFGPCVPPGGTATPHCDLTASDPGAHAEDAAAQQGFSAQLGFRVPTIVVSPFSRRHYVSHTPMDHTALIKFVEDRFIGNGQYLTARDAAQPDILEFFDFDLAPWMTPPSGLPVPREVQNTCHAETLGP